MKKMTFIILLFIGICSIKADPEWFLVETSNNKQDSIDNGDYGDPSLTNMRQGVGDGGDYQRGTVADEGGTTADEGGTTADEEGTTADEGDTTADEEGTTVDEEGTTADDGGTTADEGDTTADEGGTTADEGGTTADEGGTTADEGGTTADQENTTADSGSSCGFPNVVRNAESLPGGERTNLLEAMRKLKESPAWGSVASIHGGAPEHTTCNTGKPKEHGGDSCCLHGDSVSFLAWHRLYMDRINKDLRQLDETVAMPFWDWTVNPLPSIAESSTSSFFSGHVTVPISKYPQNVTSRAVVDNCLTNSTSLRQSVLNILAEETHDTFKKELEELHGTIHVCVGQHMSNLDVASFDPLFYLHHAFIDYLWAVYQVLRPNDNLDSSKASETMNPFGKTAGDTLECKNYDIDENSNNIVFGGMTFSQIKCETCGSNCDSTCGSDYEDTYAPETTTTKSKYGETYSAPKKKKKENKIYAGFFLRDFGTSGYVKFNICKRGSYGKEDCTIPGGKFSIFGGSKERKYNGTFPIKIDVTDAVIKAGMNETEMLRFEINSFVDLDGNDLGKTLTRFFQPITIFRKKDSQNDVFSFNFRGKGIQAPNVKVPKEYTFQIESGGNNVDEDQKCITVPNESKIETKSYMKWQWENREKYNKWNKPGTHTFNDIHCGAENEGSTITIMKHGEGYVAPEPEITAPEITTPVITTPEIATPAYGMNSITEETTHGYLDPLLN